MTRAGVSLDDVEIQLDGSGLGAPPGPSVVYCHMTGVDDYYAACRARGATIAMELADRPWGMRDFRVLDPSGNRIGFGALR
ncbi:MAG: bleomycin resistance protein [Planctomycetes bacterium]|nr:bleomycin resistance protein [Planctomycetota bacterium]